MSSRARFLFAAACLCPVLLLADPRTPAPTDLTSNLAWWSADDRGSNVTRVEVTVPADLSLWVEPQSNGDGLTVTGGQPDPFGGTQAYNMMEKAGAGFRWLAFTPAGYAPGPCKISFYYKPVNGASVWVMDGTSFYPEFEFTANGEGRSGKNPYAAGDDTWFSVVPASNGFYKADLWLQGRHIRTRVALSTVSNGVRPPAGDAGKGALLYGLAFSQSYVTALRDRSSHGAELTGAVADAPFFQASDEAANLLAGGSSLWQPDCTPKFLTTSNAALCAALGGTAPCTVLALVRRQWSRGEGAAPAAFLQAVSKTGNGYGVGFMAATSLSGSSLYAGAPGVSGPVTDWLLDTEWNVIAVVNSGTAASIYVLDGTGAALLAGPTAVSRGSISSVRLCAERAAVREMAVWGEALDVKAAQQQAAGMIARAGGQAALDTFRTFDGVTIETRTKTAPYAWRDDAGTAFFKGACWIVGGAVDNTCGFTNDVWTSTDYGATWTRIPQVKPFEPSACAAAFPLTVGGTNYLYLLNFASRSRESSIYRSTDGSEWIKVCDDPPWKGHFAMGAGVLGHAIYVMGGQTSQDPKSATSRVYKSSDGGVTWTSLGDAPWRPRVSFGPQLSTWKGKLWVVHGGTIGGFGGGGGEKFDDVWAFDGVTWERVLEHTPFPGSFWFTNFVLDDELFIMAGKATDNHDHRTMWRTSDGVHWRPSFPLPWGLAHECCATETDRGILLAPTDWNQTARLLSIKPRNVLTEKSSF